MSSALPQLRERAARTSWLVVLAWARVAVAEPVGEDAPPPPTEPTAADVDGKPVPGSESGRTDEPDGDSTLRKVGRGVLVIPKVTLEAAFLPVRGGIWTFERYHLDELARRIFFTDDMRIGLYPIAQLESGYGVNVGARFEHRDLFGAREHLKLHAGTGGRFHEIASAKLRSGDRFGERVALEVDGEYERRPKDAFYGIGADVAGVEARFREQLARAAVIGDVRVAGDLHVRGSGALADFTFANSDVGEPIDMLYPMDTMAGWHGIRHAYGELELRWDSRRAASSWEPPAVRATGWLLAGYAGRVTALDDNADYWRFGADLQRFVRLGQGPRVLSARLFGEAVSGEADVPFTQLPRLGGKMLLRGYPLDRFRDRVAAMGSVEYAWDLSRWVSASTFVDAGRVFASPRELEVTGIRVGYGLALEAHTQTTFLLRASLATSIDGGVFLDVAFDPVFDLDPRVERR